MYWALWTGFCIGKCIAGCLLLLLSFSCSFLFLSFHLKNWHQKIVKKLAPKKVGPLYLLAPLLITSGSELTFFCFPFTNHYSTLQSEANTHHQPEKTTIGISSTKIPSLKQAKTIQTKLHFRTLPTNLAMKFNQK